MRLEVGILVATLWFAEPTVSQSMAVHAGPSLPVLRLATDAESGGGALPKLTAWSPIDAGPEPARRRRLANDTTCSPGDYESSLTATNAARTWSERPPSRDFPTAPIFYQQTWFKVAGAGILLLLLTLTSFFRLEPIQERCRRRLQERRAERERIARELHDTLLQGVQSLLFRLQNWETDPGLPSGHRDEVAAVVDEARAMVIEGRDRILMLRGTGAAPPDLVEALEMIGTRESAAHGPQFSISVVGESRLLRAATLEQLVAIGREAIRNSFQHARARRIDVCVEYRNQSLILQIRDDGSGIELSTLCRQPTSGHFGLTGMRERAEQLGGRIRILRNQPRGTHVEVIVPGHDAFEDAHKRSWRRVRAVDLTATQ
jgi:signal transduction histidine kinase